MREQLDQWDFVIAAYGVTILATLLLLAFSLTAMHRAERRREQGRRT